MDIPNFTDVKSGPFRHATVRPAFFQNLFSRAIGSNSPVRTSRITDLMYHPLLCNHKKTGRFSQPVIWRREGDSNSRYEQAAQQISSLPHSTTLPSLHLPTVLSSRNHLFTCVAATSQSVVRNLRTIYILSSKKAIKKYTFLFFFVKESLFVE